jgi:hypothetical protein
VQSVNAELANEVREYIVKVKEDLESTKVNAPDSTKKRFEDAILNINIYEKKIIQTLEDIPTDEAKYKTYFDRNIIQRIFQSQINSLLTDNELSINIEEGVTSILKLVVEKNLTSSFKVDNPFYLKDATIIETPTIVQLAEFITNSLAFSPTGNQRGDLPLHYSDISQKVKISPPVSSDVFAEIFKMIKSVISGEMKFKSDEGGIVFIKNNGAIVRAFNIATGVKSLGLLQLLLNPTYVNQNSLLIIDEPEVHLHPQWEIEYAKIIVSLCASGIPVVISSHSPYLIQALSKFSKANTLVSNKTRFYFGDKSEGGFTTFIDVTNDKNPIYKKLAEPMRDLINN